MVTAGTLSSAKTWKWDGDLTSYADCFKKVQASKKSSADTSTQDFFVKGGFEFLESFEKQYDCAGLCYTPLFYLTKPLSVGPPKTSCDQAFLASVTGNTAVGAVALVTGLILLSVFVGSIPLCSGYAADGDVMGGA